MSTSDIPDPATTTFGAFLDAVSARTPAPAGGAAAGLSAAFGAALFAMVARYTTGERFAGVEAEMLALVEEARQLEQQALESVRFDQEAFGAVAVAFGLPRDSEEERAARSAAIQETMVGATAPPLLLGEVCTRLGEIARVLADGGNQNVVSDVATGAACVSAALDGTLINLEANAAGIRDEQAKARLREATARLLPHRDALRCVVDEIRGKLRVA